MKRVLSIILAALVLVSCLVLAPPGAQAAKKETARTIAIVFDNSGSMYIRGNKAWCRATYAMEVFTAMLNKGDVLLIYPMHPITVNGKSYTMESPLKITDASQSSLIRQIKTENAGGTPIESLDFAVQGLEQIQVGSKYLVVLTDGASFHENGKALSNGNTKKAIDSRIQPLIEKQISVMYLGIGEDANMPDTNEGEFFKKIKAEDSADVLSSLTEMCNLIFGRDQMPAVKNPKAGQECISGDKLNFTIPMNKLIVFVQGENIDSLKVTSSSGEIGKPVSVATTKYGTAGATNYKDAVPDTSLQGMMVTYADCDPGEYTISYSGKKTDIQVYYEPNVDLNFIFTDAATGNPVDPNALYDGEYKVSYGMVNGKTGELTESALLGNPHYEGSYFKKGEKTTIEKAGYSGEIPVTLNVGDSFDATLTVTYLSGYTITKNSSDFGWPDGGLQVKPRPAGELKLEISGGQEKYSLQHLTEGESYIAKVYYEGQLLTGDALKSTDLWWNPDMSNALIMKKLAGDHWELTLDYKDPNSPKDTVCGSCTVDIAATYTAPGSTEAKAQAPLTYNIEDDFSPLSIALSAPEDYIVISDLGKTQPFTAELRMDGAMLTEEDFAATELQVDTGGIEYKLTVNEADSSATIELLPTKGIKAKDYRIKVTGVYTDAIGRATKAQDSVTVTLSTMPLWMKWAIALGLLLLLIILILIIMHIKRLPKHMKVSRNDCTFIYNGKDVSTGAVFGTKKTKNKLEVYATYNGTKTGLTMAIKPGKNSYLRTPQLRRSAEVRSDSVGASGLANIKEATVGSAIYEINPATKKMERVPQSVKPFNVKNNTYISYSGTITDAGKPKKFAVTMKLNFKKK